LIVRRLKYCRLSTAAATEREFDEIVRAIRNGATHVNAHSANFPGGEIRERIRVVEREEDHERDNDREDHN